MNMTDKNTKNRTTKSSEPSSTKWLRIFLIAFSAMLILSMILSLIK
jgi:hypothetical protein